MPTFQIPDFLLNLVEHLKQQKMEFTFDAEDGRTDSAHHEYVVKKHIINFLKHYKNGRYEYFDADLKRAVEDFFIIDQSNGKTHLVNIKSSSFKQADNIGSAQQMLWELGIITDRKELENCRGASAERRVVSFCMSKEIKEGNPFYYLVVNKNDTSDIVINTLGTLPDIKTNGHNGFQANWNKNRDIIYREDKEKRLYLWLLFKDFFRKKIEHALALHKEIEQNDEC